MLTASLHFTLHSSFKWYQKSYLHFKVKLQYDSIKVLSTRTSQSFLLEYDGHKIGCFTNYARGRNVLKGTHAKEIYEDDL